MNAVQGQLITSGSANPTELRLSDVDSNGKQRWYFKLVTAGTIKIASSEESLSNAHEWESSDVIPPYETKNGAIWFETSDGAQDFVVTSTT